MTARKLIKALMVLSTIPTQALEFNCTYSLFKQTTFLGPDNVIQCFDNEGKAHCEQRCTSDTRCAGYGVYLPEASGRCCTKRNSLDKQEWSAGNSYTKIAQDPACPFSPSPSPAPPHPVPPAPPSAPVTVKTIFHGNRSWMYNKGAMIQALPNGGIAAACQAGARENSTDQRILYTVSANGSDWDSAEWYMPVPEPAGSNLAQWEPILFLSPSTSIGGEKLWLFWSQGRGPLSLYAITTDASSGFTRWSSKQLLYNVSALAPDRMLMWPVNRVLVSPAAPDTNTWILPCDWGCSGDKSQVATGAFAMRTTDGGVSWTAAGVIGGVAAEGLCPEPAMAYVNATTLLAVVRSVGVGFTQAWSHDDGESWTTAVPSAVDGASSKPSLIAVSNPIRRGKEYTVGGTDEYHPLLLAYNEVTRVRMALSVSLDGGDSWKYYATLENGTGIGTDCYPTNIIVGNEVLIAYSTYTRGADGSISDIRLAQTPLPQF
eukprot:m.78562 g.78562  ORF g.78562 m.78562 type:complete len:487 (-) comp16244_c0_seq1:166-1626(-)